MAQRKRNIIKRLYLNEQEEELILRKMTQANMRNFSTYARLMLLDGYIILKDFSDLRALLEAMNRIGENIQQINQKVEGTNHFNREDMRMLSLNFEQLNKSLNKSLLRVVYEDERKN